MSDTHSTRVWIQERLIETLLTITKENGYHFDVANVSKRFRSANEVTSTPCLSVICGPVTRTPRDESMVLYLADLSFAVKGFIRSEEDPGDEGTLSDLANDLLEDIEEVILKNPTTFMDSSTTQAWTLVVESDSPILDWRNRMAEVQVLITLTYYHTSDV